MSNLYVLDVPNGVYLATPNNKRDYPFIVHIENKQSKEAIKFINEDTFSFHPSTTFWADWGKFTTATNEQVKWMKECIKEGKLIENPKSEIINNFPLY